MPEGEAAFIGDNGIELLQGGDELFPAMHRAMAAARRQVWLASYIFHDDEAGQHHQGASQPSATPFLDEIFGKPRSRQ